MRILSFLVWSVLTFIIWAELAYWRGRIRSYGARCYYGFAVAAYRDGDLRDARKWLGRLEMAS